MNWNDWLVSVRTAFDELASSFSTFLPRIATALLLLLLGWLVARLSSALARQLLRRFSQLVSRRAGVDIDRGQQVGLQLLSTIVFWVVFLFFVAASTEQLGFAAVSEAVAQLARYLPLALGSVLILLASAIAAGYAESAVVAASADGGHAELLGRVTKLTILAVGGVLALEQMGIESAVLVALVSIVAAAALGSAAAAFALGARSTVENILSAHYLQRSYRPGQSIQVGEFSGRIVDISAGGVTLDSDQGQVLVPAKTFGASISVRLPERSSDGKA